MAELVRVRGSRVIYYLYFYYIATRQDHSGESSPFVRCLSKEESVDILYS